MCGIAGYFGANPVSEQRLRHCEALMRHRGPDGHGRYRHDHQGRHVQLLHSRLSIIDLDHRADQPFRVDGQVTVFNGELYNYIEIRRALQEAGRHFHTDGDTEVLATLLADGTAGLDRCEGMWAFARYDEADGTLVLCRDRFGEKPLYICQDEDGLYFGSEVKFIEALRGRGLDPDLEQLRRFLVNGYKALYKGDGTFQKGLQEIPPGVAAWFGGAAPKIERYWSPSFQPDESLSFEDAVAGVRHRLIEAVGLRLRADVPLAFCMSGGVDSNALISIAKRVYGYDVHGFTVVNKDARYEEQAVVDAVVRDLGIRHSSVHLDRDGFLDKLRGLVAAHDAPVYTISYYVHWMLMESVASQGYKISLSGTAADELFSGYYDHHIAYLAAVRADPARHAQALADWQAHIRPIVRNPYLSDPELFVRTPDFRGHIFLDAELFSARLTEPWVEPFAESRYTPDLLRNRMANELFHEAVPVILHEDDLNAMYYSVENRSPFLDRRLFEFSTTIPTRHLVRGGYAKAVLREAMRGIVPDVVLDTHRKVGFNAPILDLLDPADPAVKDCLLADSPIFALVRRDAIEQLLRAGSFNDQENKFLFSFVAAKLFLETRQAAR
jgi:asparagine synthase (glutamine-hydrolysing)